MDTCMYEYGNEHGWAASARIAQVGSHADAAFGDLELGLTANKCWSEHAKDWEGDVDGTEDEEDDVADDVDPRDVLLRDAEHGHALHPAEAGVDDEDQDAGDVERSPGLVLEKLEFQGVDVTNAYWILAAAGHPEEVELQVDDSQGVDEVGRWADQIWAKLVSVAEAELHKVDRHEGKERKSGDCKVEGPRADAHLKLLVPGTLESDTYMKQHRERDVLLHNVRRQTKASPIEADIEVSIAVEVIRPHEDVQVTDGMDDNEKDEQDGASSQAHSVIRHLKVFR